MNTSNIPQTTSEQDNQTHTQEASAKKRRRIATPVFSTRSTTRAGRPMHLMAIAVLVLSFSAQAQSDSLKTAPGIRNDRTNTMQNQQGTMPQQGQPGWVMFNDDMGKEMNLTTDQMTRLREMDKRYQAEYLALGKDPMNNPNYRALNERRNTDMQGILGQQTYTTWQSRYGGKPAGTTTPSGTKPGTGTTPGGTTTPQPKTTSPR